jgi:hypothetical protein
VKKRQLDIDVTTIKKIWKFSQYLMNCFSLIRQCRLWDNTKIPVLDLEISSLCDIVCEKGNQSCLESWNSNNGKGSEQSCLFQQMDVRASALTLFKEFLIKNQNFSQKIFMSTFAKYNNNALFFCDSSKFLWMTWCSFWISAHISL